MCIPRVQDKTVPICKDESVNIHKCAGTGRIQINEWKFSNPFLRVPWEAPEHFAVLGVTSNTDAPTSKCICPKIFEETSSPRLQGVRLYLNDAAANGGELKKEDKNEAFRKRTAVIREFVINVSRIIQRVYKVVWRSKVHISVVGPDPRWPLVILDCLQESGDRSYIGSGSGNCVQRHWLASGSVPYRRRDSSFLSMFALIWLFQLRFT